MNHSAFSLKINFYCIPHFIHLCDLFPRKFLTIHCFRLLKFSSWICNPGALCFHLFCRKLMFMVVGLGFFCLFVVWFWFCFCFYSVEFPWQRGRFPGQDFFKVSRALFLTQYLIQLSLILQRSIRSRVKITNGSGMEMDSPINPVKLGHK